MQPVLVQKLKELYWTVSRIAGFQHIHGREGEAFRIAAIKTLYFIPACLVRLTNIRFLAPTDALISHVGHMAMEFDCYFKDHVLSGRNVKTVLVGLDREPANNCLFDLWSKRMHVVRNPVLASLLKPFFLFPDLRESITHYGFVLRGSSEAHRVQARWGDRPPLLALDETLIARGEAKLRGFGVPDGAWFVCVHSREPGYAPAAEWASTYRNSDIMTYVDAMRLIVAQGGYCIRVGDATMKPLPPIPGVFDYAVSKDKADWLDLFLCGRCRFFLGSTSGLLGVAAIFGRPSVLANVAPLSSVYSIYPNVISIPKLVTENGLILDFPTAFKDGSSEFRYAAEFTERNLGHIDNTAEEIVDLVSEVLDRGHHDWIEDSELQAKFRSLVQPNHYCWHSTAQIGDRFLQRHRDLLLEAAVEPAVAAADHASEER